MAMHERELLELPFEALLAALSGKRFSALSESPDALLQCALTFECVFCVFVYIKWMLKSLFGHHQLQIIISVWLHGWRNWQQAMQQHKKPSPPPSKYILMITLLL